MANLINSVLAATLFFFFAKGLAFSIGAIPFFVIVGIVSAMLLVDLYQDNLGIIRKILGRK